MQQEHTGNRYAWHYDALHGVGRFERLSDGAITLLETGSECSDVRRQLNRLKSKTGSPHYPKAAPSFAQVFDSIASEYEYGTD